MTHLLRGRSALCAFAAIASLLAVLPARAQDTVPPAKSSSGQRLDAAPMAIYNPDGTVCNFKSGGNCSTGGGGGSLSAKANAADQTSSEGATTDPISMDLNRYLRVVSKQSGTWTVGLTGLAQGSTTSGQTGQLTMGAVTTAAPAYTTAQTSPASLDVHGSLRVLNMDATGAAIDPTAALPAGTNLLGKVGIDQTTDGTTNAVHLVAGTALAGKFGIDQTTPGTTNGIVLNSAASGALADGAIATLGLKADAATCATTNTAMACFRQLDADIKAAVPAGTNLIGKVGVDQTTPGTTNAVSLAQVGATTLLVNTGATGAGSPRVTVAVDSATVAGSASLPAGANLIGKAGIDQTTNGTTNAVVAIPATTGGLSTCRVVTGTSGFCKASAGQVFTVVWQNTNAAVRYLQIYNKASAPTLSTDTPIMTIPMALTSVGNYGVTDLGIAASNGIAWAVTTDDVAIPVTAGTSGDLHMTLSYK